MEIGGFGSEGVVALGALLFVKDVVFPLVKRVVIPWWGKKILRRPKPNDTLRRLNPSGLTLERLHDAVKQHEKMDEKRCDELKDSIKEISRNQTDYEA